MDVVRERRFIKRLAMDGLLVCLGGHEDDAIDDVSPTLLVVSLLLLLNLLLLKEGGPLVLFGVVTETCPAFIMLLQLGSTRTRRFGDDDRFVLKLL